MKQVGCSGLVVLLLAAPALAQDPFEATVGANQGDLGAKVRDLLPDRSPTATQLRTYLEAARFVGLGAAIKLDDGRGYGTTRLGDARVRTGTTVTMAAKFRRPSNGGSPVLSELSVVPSCPIQTDDFTFHRLDMDRCGNLRAKLSAQGRSINLAINKIYRDNCGNLVFKTYATNQGALVNAFVPDVRITPDGRLQTNRKNAILPRNRGWRQEYKNGRPVRVGSSLPIQSWPPRLSDLVQLLPQEGAPKRTGAAIPALPISDLGLRARVQTDPILLAKNDDGRLVLRDGDFALDVHGPVRRGVLTTDARRPNGLRVEGKLDGLIDTPDAKAKLISLQIEVEGKGRGSLPLQDLGNSRGSADLRFTAAADVADLHTRKPAEEGEEAVDLKRVKLSAEGTARLEINKKRRGVSGVLDDTKVRGEYTRLVVTQPNGARLASEAGDLDGSVRGALTDGQLSGGRARGTLTTTAPTTVDLPLALGADAHVGLAPGTKLEADTHELRPGEDGTLVSTPRARVKAHLKLESGTVDYKNMVLGGFVGDGTIDLDAALGLRLDPTEFVAEDGTPVVGPVPLDLKLTVAFAPESKLYYGAEAGDDNAVSFGGNVEVELDVQGEIDPETGKPSLKGINGANVKFKTITPLDPAVLEKLGQGAETAKLMAGDLLQNVQVEFTPEGLKLKTKNGAELRLAPKEIGFQRGERQP